MSYSLIYDSIYSIDFIIDFADWRIITMLKFTDVVRALSKQWLLTNFGISEAPNTIESSQSKLDKYEINTSGNISSSLLN